MDEDRVKRLIRGLRGRDKKGELEVEHILNLALSGDCSLINPLRELSAESGWIGINGDLIVPMAAWAEIVCDYFEGGITRIEQIVLRKDEYSTFALAVLETLNNQESAEALTRILAESYPLRPEFSEYLKRVVGVFNLVVSFGKGVLLQQPERQIAKDFLGAALAMADALGNNELIVQCVYAYRGVADEETIFYLKQRPNLPLPYHDTIDEIIKQIRKRLTKRNRL